MGKFDRLTNTDNLNNGLTKENLISQIKDLKKENESKDNEIESLKIQLQDKINQSASRDELQGIIVDDIKNNDLLSIDDKKELIDYSLSEYIKKYSVIPKDYETLKKEVKLFNGLTQINFVFLAMRLKEIRDNELYKQDNYKDFKDFYQNEIKATERTIFYYIDIIENFQLKSISVIENMQYSKLIPFLPLLKNKEIPDNDKKDIKNKAEKLLKSDKSQKDIILIAKDYKSKYGLIKQPELNIDKLVNGIIKKIPIENKAEIIQDIIDKLNDLL